ncbi:ZIP Zinc transporter family protein [Trichomonas vaginalis G3]|uniref:ZIP Zinc transporter family protein n=1 Tax=Trichomonas vaginalis (strain ATCC PRA-98 / G3) TaxID=412133 RepID=A2DZG2_TRIV3|nr:zinc ion transmembrane transporter protein [Trichomonas vaginalis G3]EAY14166.1 ZIP Zinc transporter family protein [Trichomonas vaginalis G3]KAI5540707.1 zinc ion transmembrane transporter protein [Trichomonas vaginalis G3]|eukprot:XP_001326389.1 ZIP Zinc transporter family protein [Trichomonas vaginalis G3]
MKTQIEHLKFGWSSVFLVMGLVSSVLPLFIKSISFLSVLDSFAGGVFLGAALVHLIPEGIENLNKSEIPLGSLLCLAGFLVMYLIESFGSHGHDHGASHNHDHDKNGKHNDELADDHKVKAKLINRLSPSSKAIYIALLFHSFVEAISLGVVNDLTVLKSLIYALAGHYPAEVFSLGLQIFGNKISKTKYFAMMCFYSFVTPFTIIASYYVGKACNETVSGCVVAISSGIFAFVAFHELSEALEKIHESNGKSKFYHLIAILIGALWMAGLAIGDHEHEHGHQHHHDL